MHTLSLNEYKKSPQYLLLFDVKIKDQIINKDNFLKDIGISPNTYRRSKFKEHAKCIEIVEILTKYFGLVETNIELIEFLEGFINAVYFDMYYKVYTDYDYYMKKIDELLSYNYTIYPVLKLIKLFLIINSRSYTYDTLDKNNELYKEVKKYKIFYNDDLTQIFNLLYLTFDKDSKEYIMTGNFTDGFAYSICSFISWKNKRYINSLYYAETAKNILSKESNFRRIIYLNFTIMSCYNYTHNYRACYRLATEQLRSLNSFDNIEFEKEIVLKHLLVAMLGLGMYESIVDRIKGNESYSLTELVCYLVAKSKISMDEYERFFKENIKLENYGEFNRKFLSTLNEYIISRDKKILLNLEKYEFVKAVIDILKKG